MVFAAIFHTEQESKDVATVYKEAFLTERNHQKNQVQHDWPSNDWVMEREQQE